MLPPRQTRCGKYRMKRLLQLFIPLLLLLFLPACADDFEKLNTYYNSGDYILAGQAAVKGFKTKSHQKKIQSFLNKHGHKYVTRSLKKGVRLAKTPSSEHGIIYLKDLVQIFYAFQDMAITIPNLDAGIEKANLTLEALRRQYVEIHYDLGLNALEKHRYRESIEHFENVERYHPSYKETEEKTHDATVAAQRKFKILPFFTPASPLSDLFSSGVQNVFSSRSRIDDRVKTAYIIEGVNVPQRFEYAFYKELSREKSEYVTLLEASETERKADYLIEAAIDVEVTDLQRFPHRELRSSTATYTVEENGTIQSRSTHIDYEILKTSYEIAIAVALSIRFTDSNIEAKHYKIEKTAFREQRYRTEPLSLPANAIQIFYPTDFQRFPDQPEHINTREVLTEAIEITVEDLVEKVLQDMDKDLDPLSIRKLDK